MITLNPHVRQRDVMFVGAASLIDGLVMIASLGLFMGGFRNAASLQVARWEYRRSLQIGKDPR